MTDTEQIRKWYHEGVVLNHADRGKPGYEPICNHRHPRIGIPKEGGGGFNEPVHPLTFEAWEAYVAVMRFHGESITGAGGVDNCRNIGTSDDPSLHAYLCALDNPPDSRKSAAFIADIEAIRTNSGAQVFRNLAGDRMHDQIDCSPADLATGIDWTTVIGHQGDDDMALLTEAEQQELRTFLNLIDAKNSSVSFVNQAIDDIREKNAAGDKYAPADHSHDPVEPGGPFAPEEHQHATEGRTV